MWRRLAAWCLVWVSASALAVPQPVQVAGSFQFELGAAPFYAQGFSVDFVAPEPGTAGFFVESDSAWGFRDLAALLSIDGTLRDDTAVQVAWFAYAGGYQGIDLRFADVFAPGDWLQLVLATPAPLFDGPVAAPTLRYSARSGLSGFIGYQNPDDDYIDGSLYAGRYQAGVVPEPSAVLLWLLGLPLLVGVARRRADPLWETA
jgi:hypothetical protein